MTRHWNSNDDSDHSWPSTASSSSPSEVGLRVRPQWALYSHLFQLHGFRLDTVRDAKEYYKSQGSDHTLLTISHSFLPEYIQAYSNVNDDDTLCPDYGLLDNLFRGTRIRDGMKIVIKAVHLKSREYEVIRLLSSPPLRDDPMNHTIPVADFIEVEKDDIVFIIMEQWSSRFVPDACCFKAFLVAVRQCIEHMVFMHRNQIAHLDISMYNLVTDYDGHYAYIDYELSQRFDGVEHPSISYYRCSEVPPELEKGDRSNPYKVDVWALGMTILRAWKATRNDTNIAELLPLVDLMICELPEHRPTASSILKAFEDKIASIPDHHFWSCHRCTLRHDPRV